MKYTMTPLHRSRQSNNYHCINTHLALLCLLSGLRTSRLTASAWLAACDLECLLLERTLWPWWCRLCTCAVMLFPAKTGDVVVVCSAVCFESSLVSLLSLLTSSMAARAFFCTLSWSCLILMSWSGRIERRRCSFLLPHGGSVTVVERASEMDFNTLDKSWREHQI